MNIEELTIGQARQIAAMLPTQDELIDQASRARPILDATAQATEETSNG